MAAYPGLLAAGGLVVAIITLPVLPPATLAWVTAPVQLAGKLGIADEGPGTAPLPQPIADRFGWDTLTATVAGVYRRLPPPERRITCILARNYGEAGAIDLYGPGEGLPTAISGHDAYYMWGPRNCSGAVVISVGWSRHTLATLFDQVTPAATARCRYCMRYESHIAVYVARRSRMPFSRVWPRFKLFYAEWTS